MKYGMNCHFRLVKYLQFDIITIFKIFILLINNKHLDLRHFIKQIDEIITILMLKLLSRQLQLFILQLKYYCLNSVPNCIL